MTDNQRELRRLIHLLQLRRFQLEKRWIADLIAQAETMLRENEAWYEQMKNER